VRKQTTIFLTILISLSACSNPKVDKKTISLIENKTVTDTLPIHGELSKQQLQKYYPKITDTIKDLSIIFSEPLNTQQATDIYTSMLHNSGTFDQMFLCTHDKNFNLLDCYLSFFFQFVNCFRVYTVLSILERKMCLFACLHVLNYCFKFFC
jgi:hypothetical protein